MIHAPLFGAAALVITIATGPVDPAAHNAKLSMQERMAATEPSIRSATDCITHAVTTNPHYRTEPSSLGDLIVASMPACLTPVRAMIDTYDQYYGDGAGEAFFMGPYLDVLPQAVIDSTAKDSR